MNQEGQNGQEAEESPLAVMAGGDPNEGRGPERSRAVLENHATGDRVRLRIPGDVVNKATADLPDEQRSAIRRFYGHVMDKALGLKEAGELIRRDSSTISRVFNGRYEGSLENVTEDIEAFFKLHDERLKVAKLPFVMTDQARQIFKICDTARKYQRIGYVIGETQTGKTTCGEEYARQNNHGSTVMLTLPVGCTPIVTLDTLARALRIPGRYSARELFWRIEDAFDDRMLLLVDEAHQAFLGRTSSGVKSLDYIRMLHDRKKFGVVFFGTNKLLQEMQTGEYAGIMKQSLRRRILTLPLDPIPTTRDLNSFAKVYGLPPAKDAFLKLQTEVIQQDALGMWLTLLRIANEIATDKRQRLTWEHVSYARQGLARIESGKFGKGD
jgi:DNA transposition AAA+ family ATPase